MQINLQICVIFTNFVRFLPTLSFIYPKIMQLISTKQELLAVVEACKQQKKSIGLVPTMGALHEGHASLVSRSVRENDVTFVSVFVNPTQFNNKEDLLKYPRNLSKDADLLSELGVTFVFAPTPEEMYSEQEMNTTFAFDFAGLDKVNEIKLLKYVIYKSGAFIVPDIVIY